MSFWDRLLGRTERSSREVAKERLQVVLTSDRTNISPALLELLKDDIIRSISEHVEIDRDGIQIAVSQGRGYHQVVANIPVVRARESDGRPTPPRRRKRSAASAQPVQGE